MASPDEQVGVAFHEMLSHGDLDSVGKKSVGMSLECLDVAENVVPSAAVQSGRVIFQLVENFIHLKDGRECFNEHGGPYAPVVDSSHFLRLLKHSVPYLGFPGVFHFREIEKGSKSFSLGLAK